MNEVLDQMKADLGQILTSAGAFGVGSEALQHGFDVSLWVFGPVEIATALAFGITLLIGARLGRRTRRR